MEGVVVKGLKEHKREVQLHKCAAKVWLFAVPGVVLTQVAQRAVACCEAVKLQRATQR